MHDNSVQTFDEDQVFNFFPLPTDLHFGRGVLSQLPDHMADLGGDHAFIVTDSGIREAGLVDRVVEVLDDANLSYTVFDRVKPDSGSNVIAESRDRFTSSDANVVIGLGGGSSLDTAKATASLANNPGSPLEYVGLHRLANRGAPVIAIPTTAGTGSEVTLWSVFTDETRDVKVAIGDFKNYPSVALCDPELTISLPSKMSAATGMDALAHAVESFTNRATQPISASLSLSAIELIGRYLRKVVSRGDDVEARCGMMMASTMAGIAMNPTRLGLAHALAMPLGSWELQVPHGIGIAVTLPRVMEFNHTAAPRRFASVAAALGEAEGDMDAKEAAGRSVEAVRALGQDIGIPTGLSEYGVGEDDVSRVVEEAMESGNVPVNPRETTADQLAQILRNSL